MLSKVLSGRDAKRIQPMVFAPLSPGQFHVAQHSPRAQDAPGEDRTAALEQRIRQLEAEVVSARQEALDAGRQQGRAEIAPVIERMNASVAEMSGMRQELRRRAEKDVVQLALLIARRVLHRQLNVDENALTALARMALDRLSRADSCRIVVHPQFVGAVKAAVPGGQASRISIDTDASCAPGTLILHADSGVIDASVEAQLDEIERGLTDRLRNTE